MDHRGKAHMKRLWPLLLAGFLLLTGCGLRGRIMDGDGMVNSYKQISQEEAKEMMARNDGHVVVDVRRQDEYDAGHIPGAILIPNESIGDTKPEELPDLNQIILIFCRSGNRSKQAAEKLFDMGYRNVFEFGGIVDWTGEIVTEEHPEIKIWTADELPVSLRYDRLWEYGEYCETTDAEQIEEIVAAIRALKVGAQSDVCVDDYTDILTFSFADGTTLTLEFEGQSWVKDTDTRYSVEGLSRLRNLLDEVLEEQTSNAMRPVPTLVIESNRHIFYATLADNSSAEVF